jgi:mono/diheme cytochrome c family protein
VLVGACLAALALCTARAAAPAPEVDFNREIRPILSANCYACHGPDEAKRKGGLRLDERDHLLQPASSGKPGLVPGHPADSELIRRLETQDEDDRMPPPKTGKTLSAPQVDLLRRWIAQGAPWKQHWAFVKPDRPAPPHVRNARWPRQELDRIVLARLHQERLKPSPEAPRETLIRRVSLDLTGLPPTPAEVDAFLKDRRPDAYERVVDRLLASPHHGERWARPWLDQARYADSNGYEKDELRTMWPYRDWVIRALNEDMPFDQFTVEQLAGDLLPNATRDQKIATGFHRNTMVNTEGGTDDEEFRTAALIDRVNTTFTVWTGTTFGCAQCHSHKYDPFSQADYYQVFAILNQTRDKGKSNDPILELPSPDQKRLRDEVRAQIEPLQKQLDSQTPALDAEQASWEAGVRAHFTALQSGWNPLTPSQPEASGGVVLEPQPDGSLLSAGSLPDESVYSVHCDLQVGTFTALRLETFADERLPNGSCGRSEEGDFVLTDLTLAIRSAGGTTNHVAFESAYADFAMDGYDAPKAIDDNARSGWSIAAHEAANRTHHHAVFLLKEPATIAAGSRARIVLKQESHRAQHLLGRFRLSGSTTPTEAHRSWSKVPAAIRRLLAQPADTLTDAQRAELAKHHRSIAPSLDHLRMQVADLKKKEPKGIPSTLVMEPVESARETHMLIRGSHLNPGPVVQPGVPQALHPWPKDQPVNRLEFARWLVSDQNPLVGRVTMNRIWAQYFGVGIVETSEEFGSQGEPPANQELLDWLATELIRQRWSLKAMHRIIVTSATYRQASTVTPLLKERDPFNRLLARGPRFRIEAEMLRDQALAVSGLLNPRVGGPSVFPYQPEGIWIAPYSGDRWVTGKDGDQFRRGLYTFWRRTSPYASFLAFDAPSREVCTERRLRSNTPVQALVTLNDPAFVAAAAGLARRVVSEGGATDKDRLMFAFRAVTARRPQARESRRLLDLLASSRQRYAADPASAGKLASIGLGKPPDGSGLADLAAWTVVANVLLNLDETLTKG